MANSKKFAGFVGYVLLILVISSANCAYPTPEGCSPYGVRLALGRSYFDNNDNQTLSIWFNTKLECLKSHVEIIKQTPNSQQIYCDSKLLTFSTYSTYVHRCSFDFLKRGQNFSYQVYGWTGNQADPNVSFTNASINVHLLGDDQEVKMFVIGDWGYLETKANQYDRLDAAIDALTKNTDQPNLAYLGGDYGYDLSTNSGRNYDNFLIMLSQFSRKWPCIFNIGNHEYNAKQDFLLFNSSFELYNITVSNITMINLPKFSFLIFDPYNILYKKASKTELFQKLKDSLQKAPKNKPIVVSSHYPLTCSAFFTAHCTDMINLVNDFFQTMIDYNVILYIGAHYHTYERIYPYVKGKDFKKINSPYNFDKSSKYLLSIVQGIAGNDQLIVPLYLNIMGTTAAASYGKTGYGIMKVDQKRLQYEHFKAVDWVRATDSMVIGFENLLKNNNLQGETTTDLPSTPSAPSTGTGNLNIRNIVNIFQKIKNGLGSIFGK